MQLKYFLLALSANSALAALESFTLNDGSTIEADPEGIVDALHPDSDNKVRSLDTGAPDAKQLFARACLDPAYPTTCQNGNWCCQPNNICCENRSCVNPDTQNCCLYGYYCNKPYRCVKRPNGSIGCLA
ncbi:hypothetical protein ASPSYDRAFT_42008 [Aspergillus sydowii CBS 593.65]|uniref:Granulins domain-containing protein n=1 Tax=Aspergillus sydowii CBS 593.65 TaxID=1036612 RepID=A0A1L9TLM5_9EURO|nr:uncharacterized protein ASPSYDRAFT_42008 [Aspergillus sydowii CBS 593.65]OJJ60281.1 hypothetical protein ASPSYDRAFT_42008 [Aspergillus sydowii CBS 593.65]